MASDLPNRPKNTGEAAKPVDPVRAGQARGREDRPALRGRSPQVGEGSRGARRQGGRHRRPTDEAGRRRGRADERQAGRRVLVQPDHRERGDDQ